MRHCRSKSLINFIILAIYLGGPVYADDSGPFAESFDIVWNTINQRFYDTGFNGVDWAKSRQRFHLRVVGAESKDEFYTQINTMLFELGVSHLGVVPSDDVRQLGEAAIFGEGTVGIDARMVDGSLLITRVEKGSSAGQHGLLPGDEIVGLNGRTIPEIEKSRLSFRTPPFSKRNECYMLLQEVYWELMGPVEDQVLIAYRDHDGKPGEVVLKRHPRGAEVVFEDGMLPTYVTLDAHRVGDNVGYIRFNSFHPELLDDLARAMNQFANSEGLIIDLRGNPGGAFGVRHQLASRFVTERSVIWNYRGRGGMEQIYLEPVEQPYLGKLVILVDGFCASSSEEFSGGLQFMGRATVVGERTPGRDLVGDFLALPVGAYFVFSVAETQAVDGTVLEYRGVIPDVAVPLTREALIAGRDVQLEAAIRVLQKLN